ncbi:sigma-70 family RNA polymerase sigma factor [uncultured Polaribacter sp.]|uniref:RNA polymerase sigma factor n=1 Tax=uncultured Polaribacter sp. TaxID=174711 RepID=UPI0026096063|nr:sigma-70 family RNA polymerase sigma factor [uncultured Polaribacter sp.]
MSLELRIYNGDRGAFEIVYRLYFKKVFYVAKKYAPKEIDVDDVVQEVFLKLWRKRKNISTEISIEQQLFTITKNVVLNLLRARVSQQQLLLKLKVEKANDTIEEEDFSEIRLKKINSVVKKLPKKQQKIFRMYRDEGLTYNEIATALSISKNTVSSHLNSAMTFLKKECLE